MLSVCGTIDLDLGQATLHGAETVVHVRNVFGTVTILVPRGVHVSVDGGGAFGTREIDLPDTGPVGDAPRLRIVTSGVGRDAARQDLTRAPRPRASSRSRSRALAVSAAARSNSARASPARPSFASRSPRTLGSRW